MESTADTFDRWAGRISRFNTSRIELLAALGGAVGLGFAILDGTVLLWAGLSAVMLVVMMAGGLHSGSVPRRVRPWLVLAIAPFVNQLALVSIELYAVLVLSALAWWLVPYLLRAVSWALRVGGGESLT